MKTKYEIEFAKKRWLMKCDMASMIGDVDAINYSNGAIDALNWVIEKSNFKKENKFKMFLFNLKKILYRYN